MATRTESVHIRYCDRCEERCQKDAPRIMLTADGVTELDEGVTNPNAIDACTSCRKSAVTWWTGPERRAK